MLKNTRYPDLMPSKNYHLGSVENENISSDKNLFKLLFSNNEMQKQTKSIIKNRLISNFGKFFLLIHIFPKTFFQYQSQLSQWKCLDGG